MIYTGLNRTGEIETIKTHGGGEIAEVYGGINYQNPIFYSKKTLKGTSPLTFKALGQPLKEWEIYGETVQVGVPSPDNPADVQGCGDRTENLFDYKTMADSIINYYLDENGVLNNFDGWKVSDYIPCNGNTFTLCNILGNAPAICLYDENKEFIIGKKYNSQGATINITITSPRVAKYIRFSIFFTTDASKIMLVEGSSVPSAYIPYGYKIPITVGGETKTVYLNEPLRRIGEYADTLDSNGIVTRRIYESVLTNEIFSEQWAQYTFDCMMLYNSHKYIVPSDQLSTHFIYNPVQVNVARTIIDGEFANQRNGGNYNLLIKRVGLTLTEFNNFVASQYNNGTPIKIYFALQTPTTEQVTVPSLPTLVGNNTLSIGTTVKPSAISITDGIKPTGYGQLLDVNDVDIQDSTGEPIYIQG